MNIIISFKKGSSGERGVETPILMSVTIGDRECREEMIFDLHPEFRFKASGGQNFPQLESLAEKLILVSPLAVTVPNNPPENGAHRG